MPIVAGAVRGVSFDYGHVLGSLDLFALAGRLRSWSLEFGATREERRDDETLVSLLRAAHPRSLLAHDRVVAEGLGHEAGWRALMATLVSAVWPAASPSETEAVVGALWDAQPTRNLWRYVPEEARSLLSSLAAQGVPMVLTSNSEGRAAELLLELGLAQYFIEVLDSGRLGFAKPDRRMFERALSVLGLGAASVVHVGDSETADIVGARSAGLWALRFDGLLPSKASEPTVAHARATTYEELRRELARALALSI